MSSPLSVSVCIRLQHAAPLLLTEFIFPIVFLFIPAAFVTARCDEVITHVNAIEAHSDGWFERSRYPVPPHVGDEPVGARSTDAVTASQNSAVRSSDSWSKPENLQRFLEYLTVCHPLHNHQLVCCGLDSDWMDRGWLVLFVCLSVARFGFPNIESSNFTDFCESVGCDARIAVCTGVGQSRTLIT